MIELNNDYRHKGCVDTIAGVDETGVLIVKREDLKPEPKYWLEAIPAHTIERIDFKTHISITGIFVGLVTGTLGVFMVYSLFTATEGHFSLCLMIGLPLAGLVYTLGCRRKKLVCFTREEYFEWISGPLQFKASQAHVQAVKQWAVEKHIMFNGRVEPPI